ncbi:MAG TPA: translation elongation factor Ts [Acidimicrobiales bacterium]|nr:translation elongation factor Ts [Acidimicrobiales bacterium]
MAEFTAKDVQRLRQASGVGMMDAKRALQESDGDYEAATRWLRERGLAKAGERGDRVSAQGAVAVADEGRSAAVVALLCETDFVAKSPEFTSLVDDLAKLVAAQGEGAVAERQDELDNLRITLKENIQLGAVQRFEAPEGAVLDGYLHVQNGRGVNGVLVELQGGEKALAHEVALHVASQRPQWLSRDEVPPERVAEERQVLENLTRNEGKPEQAIPKIVEGRLNGFFKERCLLEQAWVKDPKQTISQLLGGATVTRFAQVEIGR